MSITSTITLTNEEDISGYNNAAKIFLLGGDPKASPEKLDPSDPANTFILNSEDFINLQKYVCSCTALPSTTELFEAEYSKENLKKFFDSDDTLYDFMKIVLPRMHKRANDFQIDAIEPMITLGGSIGNFADTAGRKLETIVEYLLIMGEPGMVKRSDRFNSAKKKVDKSLDHLISHAEGVEKDCGGMFAKLSKYKVDTNNEDLKDILRIDERLKKIIPDEEAKKSKVQNFIDEAKYVVETLRLTIEAQKEEARENGSFKWYYIFIPVIGGVVFLFDFFRHRSLMKSLKELNERYEQVKRKGENAIESITAASHQLDSLTSEIKGVTATINNALLAVDKMQKTFGALKTMFENVKANLQRAISDIGDENALDYDIPLDDIKASAETWKRVHQLSKHFQSTGLVINLEDVPWEAEDEKATY